MKLIINISEESYNKCMDKFRKDGILTHEEFLITQGKPYEERPKGRWLRANGTYYCSHCRHYAYESQKFDFCHDCGADMRGDTE